MLNFKTNRSKREHDAYEKGLQRDLWKHFKLAGFLEKKNRNRIIKNLINEENLKNFKILEIGCKEWVKLIHDNFKTNPAALDCINISPSEMSGAKKYANKLDLRYLPNWILMDAHELDYEDESMDLIIGMGILHHLSLTEVYSEINRVLKPGGIAFWLEPLDINPLLTLARVLTPKSRTDDEEPFKIKHLNLTKKYFPKTNFVYQEFFTFFFSPFLGLMPKRIANLIMIILYKIDCFLLKIFPIFGYLYRTVFIIMRK
tara:strand:+ start:51 stop:824 length:774 start_codon:yes stop_codon:yes gene_type:complete